MRDSAVQGAESGRAASFGGTGIVFGGRQPCPAVCRQWVPKHQERMERPMTFRKASQSLVLVVDDETKVLEEVSAILSRANFACRTCSTCEEAVEAVAEDTPDLIISDINLHGQSGLEMCERIKQNPELRDVPVMFLSGAQIPDIIRRSHAVGGTYYLRKPFDPEVLLELIDKAMWMPHLVAAHSGAH